MDEARPTPSTARDEGYPGVDGFLNHFENGNFPARINGRQGDFFTHVSPYSRKYMNMSGNKFASRLAGEQQNAPPSGFPGHSSSKKLPGRSCGDCRGQSIRATPASSRKQPGHSAFMSHERAAHEMAEQHGMVHPFTSHFTNYHQAMMAETSRADSSMFNRFYTPQKGNAGRFDEEDYEINPQNIYDLSNQKALGRGRKVPIGPVAPSDLETYDSSQAHYNARVQHYHYQQYMESLRNFQTQQVMVKDCPMHAAESSEGGASDHYQETMALMQAQAHAYAFSCFLYFSHMAKIS